jgi:NAD(P)-dependent dehydrogenase (short-subunit alcohol dehydrogenase family)
MRLQDKVAVVFGAGQTAGETIGNGRATAILFAREGAKVVLVDRDEASVLETKMMIAAEGGHASTAIADVINEGQVKAAIDQVMGKHGRIDILHNNVGIGRNDTGQTHMTEEIWDTTMDVHLKGVVFACKHVLPIMRAQQSGSIINISSIAAVCAVGIIAYKASKAALNAYNHSVAMGNAKYGIRANVIMPGLMDTPMAVEGYVKATDMAREDVRAARNARVPLQQHMGTAWDVAHAAVFLASDEAKFITGVELPVDGGQRAQIG